MNALTAWSNETTNKPTHPDLARLMGELARAAIKAIEHESEPEVYERYTREYWAIKKQVFNQLKLEVA